MSWQHQLKGDPLAWLLAPDPPGVRYLALRDLLGMPSDDPELRAAAQAAHMQGPIATILAHMDPAGYWAIPGPGYNPKYRSTVWSVIMLAQLGAACAADERIARACDYLVSCALTPGGQFSASGAPSGTADCLQGNLCWALVTLGYDLPELLVMAGGLPAPEPVPPQAVLSSVVALVTGVLYMLGTVASWKRLRPHAGA